MAWKPEPRIERELPAGEYARRYPCVGSGLCCFSTLCDIGAAKYAGTPNPLPCPSLVHDGDRFWCGELLDAAPEQAAKYRRWLHIGEHAGGCVTGPGANVARQLIHAMNAIVAGDVEPVPPGYVCKPCGEAIEATDESWAHEALGGHSECVYRLLYVQCAKAQEREVDPGETAPGRAAARAVLEAARRRAAEKQAAGDERLYALRIVRR